MDGRIAAVLDGGQCEVGVESTVICFDDPETIHVLRPGLICAEELLPYAGAVYVDPAVFEQAAPDAKVASPGMKYKHYAPRARILPVEADSFDGYAAYVRAHADAHTWCLLFDTDPEVPGIPCMRYGDDGARQAHDLFCRFRELDAAGAVTVYVRGPSSQGRSLGVYNRLLRAAGFEVINL